MQELRLVAVSEDGSYLVLATAGRGTRFTLPVDDRLRAAVRGHFSRLGQYEIEVESPLRPKEIQARIRAGETAEEIADTAGIPVERVRWFEGPVLQEREYMAQQAQRVTVRRPGEQAPGPPLGEIVEERLGRRGVDLEEAEWDSWKCEDSTWRVRLSFSLDARPYAADWGYDPRRRHISALNDEAERLSALDYEEPADDTVTPFLPRRAMKVVSDPPQGPAAMPREREETAPAQAPSPPPGPPAEPAAGPVRESPPEPVRDVPPEPAPEPPAPRPAARVRTDVATGPAGTPPLAEPTEPTGPTEPTEPTGPAETAEPAPPPAAQNAPPAPPKKPQPAARPAKREQPAAKKRPDGKSAEQKRAEPETAERTAAPVADEPAAAAAAAGGAESAPPPAQDKRPATRKKARGKRASVPSWDEIMFGARRPD